MNLADVFTVVLSVLALLVVFVGCWLLATGLFPHRVERCAEQLGGAPVKCGLVGLGCLIPLLLAGIQIGKVAQTAPGKLSSVGLILATILIALFGTAGLALRIGQGLASPRDQQEPWRRVLRGGVVLAITYGTIVLLPLTLIAGFGAFVLTQRPRRLAPPPPPMAA